MNSFKILLVDDFAAWRSYVRSVLKERENFQVLGEAVDGQEAIEKATQLQPDLVVMDVAMPKMNGIEAAKHIRVSAPNAKILFLSVEPVDELAEAALAVGGQGYLLKSEVRSKLLPIIDNLFRKSG
jgi:two-component system, NarL family, response regulator YdfI